MEEIFGINIKIPGKKAITASSSPSSPSSASSRPNRIKNPVKSKALEALEAQEALKKGGSQSGGANDSFYSVPQINFGSSSLSYYVSIYLELEKGTLLTTSKSINASCDVGYNKVMFSLAKFLGQEPVIQPDYNKLPDSILNTNQLSNNNNNNSNNNSSNNNNNNSSNNNNNNMSKNRMPFNNIRRTRRERRGGKKINTNKKTQKNSKK